MKYEHVCFCCDCQVWFSIIVDENETRSVGVHEGHDVRLAETERIPDEVDIAREAEIQAGA